MGGALRVEVGEEFAAHETALIVLGPAVVPLAQVHRVMHQVSRRCSFRFEIGPIGFGPDALERQLALELHLLLPRLVPLLQIRLYYSVYSDSVG